MIVSERLRLRSEIIGRSNFFDLVFNVQLTCGFCKEFATPSCLCGERNENNFRTFLFTKTNVDTIYLFRIEFCKTFNYKLLLRQSTVL